MIDPLGLAGITRDIEQLPDNETRRDNEIFSASPPNGVGKSCPMGSFVILKMHCSEISDPDFCESGLGRGRVISH